MLVCGCMILIDLKLEMLITGIFSLNTYHRGLLLKRFCREFIPTPFRSNGSGYFSVKCEKNENKKLFSYQLKWLELPDSVFYSFNDLSFSNIDDNYFQRDILSGKFKTFFDHHG